MSITSDYTVIEKLQANMKQSSEKFNDAYNKLLEWCGVSKVKK